MSIMDSLETVYPFWAANRQCAPMMVTVVKEGPASLEIAITRSAVTPQSAPMESIVIMESAGIHALIHQTVLRSRQVISANMDCASVREACARLCADGSKWMVYTSCIGSYCMVKTDSSRTLTQNSSRGLIK